MCMLRPDVLRMQKPPYNNACMMFNQVGHKLKTLLPSMTVGSFIGDTLRVRH